jgi:hypothetical protein
MRAGKLEVDLHGELVFGSAVIVNLNLLDITGVLSRVLRKSCGVNAAKPCSQICLASKTKIGLPDSCNAADKIFSTRKSVFLLQ